MDSGSAAGMTGIARNVLARLKIATKSATWRKIARTFLAILAIGCVY
jgi:hypothetical protein